VLEQVDEREGVEDVAVAEDEVLVELRAVLAVQVDVEQLALPQRLGDGVREVEVGHLLVADLGVHAEQLGVVELSDERDGVADGRQEDVAARLVRLGLQREAQAVAAGLGVLGERVQALAVALERRLHVLGGGDLRALAATPHDVGLRAELGGEVHVAHDLAQGVAAHVAPVAGEPALLEDRVREQVRGHHRHDEAGALERGAERLDVLLAGVSSLPNGMRSSSWKVTPYAPRSDSRSTVSTGSIAARSRRRTGRAPASRRSTGRR
jgi:hypothetical protein